MIIAMKFSSTMTAPILVSGDAVMAHAIRQGVSADGAFLSLSFTTPRMRR